MRLNEREDILELTREWKGERFPDGRPRVSDEKLAIIKTLTQEEIWHPLYFSGYRFQFQGNLRTLHQGKKLYGRAVTCCFAPQRPDLRRLSFDTAAAKGWKGDCNQWVIDSLVEGDVVVCDLYDKIFKGTFVGGNLTTAVKARTKTGGAVVWGGVRDIEQMRKIDAQVYFRGVDPTPIRDCELTAFNGPCRIGEAICLPGDIVVGSDNGVLFLPSHMVDLVIENAYKMQVRDLYGFPKLEQGIYTTAARGIGKSIAVLFARQGAEIYFAGRNEAYVRAAEEELQRLNPACRGYVCDLALGEQSEAAAAQALRDSGGFHVLVCTVGVNCHCTVEDFRDEDMARLIETNYLSGLRFARRFAASLRKNKGCIVNISSIHSQMTQPTNMIYAGTKGAMNAAARAMALDFAPDGVRVNTVAPGLILSDVMQDVMDGMATQKEKDQFLKDCAKCQPLPSGCMEDIANAALFFASDMAAYITGQCLLVDGGTSIKAHDFFPGA